jgi:hypothetical protein
LHFIGFFDAGKKCSQRCIQLRLRVDIALRRIKKCRIVSETAPRAGYGLTFVMQQIEPHWISG